MADRPADPPPGGAAGGGGEGAASLELVAAALRQDTADVAVYARVLTTTLADVLPPGAVSVERDRSLADRLAGREGEVREVQARIGEQVLTLRAGRSGPVGEIRREVRGIVLSREQVGLDVWVAQLAAAVTAAARANARASDALRRFVLGQG